MFKKISEIRDNLFIRKRIIALLISVSLLLIIYVVILASSFQGFQGDVIERQKANTEKLMKMSDFIENIFGIIIKSHILSHNSLNSDVVNNTLQIDLLETRMQDFKEHIYESQQEAYDKLLFESRNYVSILKQINSLELQGKYEQALSLKSEKEIVSFNKLEEIIISLQKENEERLMFANDRASEVKLRMVTRLYIGGVILLIFVLVSALILFAGIKSYYRSLSNHLEILSSGLIPKENLKNHKNEFGVLAVMVNSLSLNMSKLISFATDLSMGNYSSKYKTIGKNDVLGQALIDLRDNLNKTQEADKRRKLEDERRNWTNSGHALFGEILRKRSQGINQLADDVIKNIVHYLSANQGGLFVINDDKIELISAFAYDRKKFVEREIKIGDGLIGTVALEKSTIFLDEIPKDYIEIESGLGDAKPNNLLIVPLKFEDDVLGVVEIASFKTIQKHEIEFVEQLGQSIASTLLTVRINEQTEQLLNDSQKKSEELSLREDEAIQNMEKMKATQELAERREADLTGILSAVDNTLMKGEYELDGTLISVNDRHLQTMGYQLWEIKGKNIEIFIPEAELEDFRKIWTSVISGTPRQVEVKRRTKTGEVLWLINQYTPVTNTEGEINRVLYLAHDITRYKLENNENITKEAILESSREASELNDEIEKRKKELNEIEQELKKLSNQKTESADEYLESDIDKMYNKWLDGFE